MCKWKAQTLTSVMPDCGWNQGQPDRWWQPEEAGQDHENVCWQAAWTEAGRDRHLGPFRPETGLTILEGQPRGTFTSLQGSEDSNHDEPPLQLAPKAAPWGWGSTGWQPSRTCSSASKTSVTKTRVRQPQLARASLAPSRSKPKIVPRRKLYCRPCIIPQ